MKKLLLFALLAQGTVGLTDVAQSQLVLNFFNPPTLESGNNDNQPVAGESYRFEVFGATMADPQSFDMIVTYVAIESANPSPSGPGGATFYDTDPDIVRTPSAADRLLASPGRFRSLSPVRQHSWPFQRQFSLAAGGASVNG